MPPWTRLAARGGRNVPWVRALMIGRVIVERVGPAWRSLDRAEQQELVRIVKRARMGPGAVSPTERAELRRIVTKAARAGATGRRR